MRIVIATDERQPNERYRGALLCAGALPEEVELALPGAPLPRDLDALLLAGGPDVDPARYGEAPRSSRVEVCPGRDALDFALLEAAAASGAPVLGICRGLQVMNVALGGTLWQDLPTDRPGGERHELDGEEGLDLAHPAHEVELAGGSLEALGALAAVAAVDAVARAASGPGTRLLVNSRHHQAVRELAPGLVPAASSAEGLVEAFERPGPFFAAVQWHPEDLVSAPAHRALFVSFLEAARSRAASRGRSSPPTVEVVLEGRIPVVRLRRSAAASTLTAGMASLLARTVETLASDPTVHAIVLTGGAGGFCSGLDTEVLEALLCARDERGWRELLHESALAARAILAAPRPVLAAIDGPAAGAGLTLALACDVRVAASSGARAAVFRLGNADAGMAPPPGAAALLANVAGSGSAADLAFSAQPFPASRALASGIVDHLVEDGASLPWALGRATLYAEHPVEALAATKRALDRGRLSLFDAALDGELESHLQLFRAGVPARRLAALKRARSNRKETS